MSVNITWLGHAGVMIRYISSVVYIDPWKVDPALPKADIILLTHDHYDHYSENDVRMLSNDSTRVVAPMASSLVTDRMKPGDVLKIGDVTVSTIPAYNINKDFHPRKNNWVGYVVGIGGKVLYHAGDTDRIDEMKGVKADMVFLPVGGTYTMTASEAVMAIDDIKPAHAVPIHFGDIVGTKDDAKRLMESRICKVHILDKGDTISLD